MPKHGNVWLGRDRLFNLVLRSIVSFASPIPVPLVYALQAGLYAEKWLSDACPAYSLAAALLECHSVGLAACLHCCGVNAPWLLMRQCKVSGYE
jgi:hypothetical protein